jgi:hypothetical protein
MFLFEIQLNPRKFIVAQQKAQDFPISKNMTTDNKKHHKHKSKPKTNL